MTLTKITAVALSLGMMCTGAALAAPKNKHDGTWQVQMVTDSGICGTNTYSITVEQGNVRYHGNPGDTPAQISGRIATNGAVSLDINRGARVEMHAELRHAAASRDFTTVPLSVRMFG